jgi:hypothetical protein
MNFRFIPVLSALESRENPSVPYLDPLGATAPPPSDPAPAPAPVDPTAAIIAAATGAATGTTPTNPNDPILGNNSIYNVPLLPVSNTP